MFTKLNLWREQMAYRRYLKLNIKRKAKCPSSIKLYDMLDAIRRRIGYVK